MSRSRHFEGFLAPANMLLAIFSVLILFYLFFSPALAAPSFPQDTFFILSDGWRFANGQIPYKDYYSPLGPLPGLLTGLGMMMSHRSGLAHSVLIGQGLLLLLLLPASLFVAYRRLRAPIGALFCFVIVSLMATRVPLGDPSTSHLTITGTYNSQGYALLLVFSLMVLLRPLHESRRTQIAEVVVGGALLFFMFFDKISYFGAAIAVLIVAGIIPILVPSSKGLGVPARTVIGMMASFIVLGALVFLIFGISPLKIINDLSGLAKAQAAFQIRPTRLQRLPKVAFDGLRQYALLLSVFPLMLRFVYGRLTRRHTLVLLALSVFLFVLNVGLMLGNLLQLADLYLVLMLAFVLAESFARNGAPVQPMGKLLISATLVLTVLQHQTMAVVSTARAAAIEFRSGPVPNRWLAGTGLADLVIPNDEALPDNGGTIDLLSPAPSGWPLVAVVRQVNVDGGVWSSYEMSQFLHDGQCLLLENSTRNDRVFTDWVYEMFSLLRPQAPPTGGGLGYGPGFDMDVSTAHTRAVLADVTLIMTPRGGVLAQAFMDKPEAGAFITSNFSKVGASRYWSLWRRKGTAGPQSPAACPADGTAG